MMSTVCPTRNTAVKCSSDSLVLEVLDLAAAMANAANVRPELLECVARQVADALYNPATMGVLLSELTFAAASRPTFADNPHGIYFFILNAKVLYVGSTVGRTFHERLAAHLEPYAAGLLNSCVKSMVAQCPELYPDHAFAAQAVVNQGRILFCPAGFCREPNRQAQRKIIREVEHLLRHLLAPINGCKKCHNTKAKKGASNNNVA